MLGSRVRTPVESQSPGGEIGRHATLRGWWPLVVLVRVQFWALKKKNAQSGAFFYAQYYAWHNPLHGYLHHLRIKNTWWKIQRKAPLGRISSVMRPTMYSEKKAQNPPSPLLWMTMMRMAHTVATAAATCYLAVKVNLIQAVVGQALMRLNMAPSMKRKT